MYQAKTTPTTASVTAYLNAIEDPARRKDCKAIAALMTRVTGCKPHMWGIGIVGFDSYHYQYASGHSGDSCAVGFANRKGDISIYLMGGYDSAEAKALLARLGRHKIGKACLYLRSLAEVDMTVLEQLVSNSYRYIKTTYPS